MSTEKQMRLEPISPATFTAFICDNKPQALRWYYWLSCQVEVMGNDLLAAFDGDRIAGVLSFREHRCSYILIGYADRRKGIAPWMLKTAGIRQLLCDKPRLYPWLKSQGFEHFGPFWFKH